MNVNDKSNKYGSFVLWSDGFIRSFVKYKDNNVWITTISIPDLNRWMYNSEVSQEVATLTKGISLFDPS